MFFIFLEAAANRPRPFCLVHDILASELLSVAMQNLINMFIIVCSRKKIVNKKLNYTFSFS